MGDESREDRLPGRPGFSPWPLLVAAAVLVMSGVWFEPFFEQLLERDEDAFTNELVALGIYLAGLSVTIALFTNRGRSLEARAQPLCPSCLHPYVDGAHFCPRCSCPQTWFAGTGEYEQVYAQAWILGEASRRPTCRMHVWFLTLLAIAFAAPVPLWFVSWWEWRDVGMDAANTGVSILSFAIQLVILYVFAKLATNGWRNWSRFRRTGEHRAREPSVAPWWTYDRWWVLPEPDEEAAGT